MASLLNFFTSYLGVNPAVGCRNGCAYCVLEKDVPNPEIREERATGKFTLEHLLQDERVTAKNALAFYNLSDPFLKENACSLLEMLEGLEAKGYQNPVVLITKLNPEKTAPEEKTLQRLARLKNLKPVLMVSYANNPKEVEPVSKSARLELMKEAKRKGIPIVHYCRPLWEKWTPKQKLEEMAEEVAGKVDGVVLGGLVVTEDIKKKIQSRKAAVPEWGNEKGRYLEGGYEQFALNIFKRKNIPVFLNSSCGISYALKIPNYMGYYWRFGRGSGEKICMRPCEAKQRERCASAVPTIKIGEEEKVKQWLEKFEAKKTMFKIEKGYINIFAWLKEQEIRMMRQQTGVYVYAGYVFKNSGYSPKVV